MIKLNKKRAMKTFLVLVFLWLLWTIIVRPSNDRDWSLDQAVLPFSEINQNKATVHNIRNFSYTSTTDYTPDYYDKTFDLNKIKSVSYVVEPFSQWAGSAHTFLTFEFEGDEYVTVSVEIRKEKDEAFSILKGFLKQYELMYVIADEKDTIKLRSNYRKDSVYIYPIKSSKEETKRLFLDILKRTNSLKNNPEFYNTITNNCTTNIVKHVNKISLKNIPLSLKVIFPGYSDKFVYDLGLIDTDLSFTDTKSKYLINERAEKYADDPNFSIRIRE